MIAKAQQVEPHPRLWTSEEFERLKELGFFDGESVGLGAGKIVLRHYSELQRRPWSKEEAYRLTGLGFFEGQKAELIRGVLMVASQQLAPHYFALDRAAGLLRHGWAGVWVRAQGPLDLGPTTEPEPDVSVVTGRRDDYTAHPTTALLAIEVSATTLTYDREDMAGLYALAGIQDYWIINLVQHQLEVYRRPVPDLSYPFGRRYADVGYYFRGQSLSPLAAPSFVIAVSDLVP
jgi:Uma2 family endonuclease